MEQEQEKMEDDHEDTEILSKSSSDCQNQNVADLSSSIFIETPLPPLTSDPMPLSAPPSTLNLDEDENVHGGESLCDATSLSLETPKDSVENMDVDVVMKDKSSSSVLKVGNKNTRGPKRVGPSSEKYLLSDEMKFMANFDPSQRMVRKRVKRYTETGIIIESCDCLIPDCAGCHFPCKICRSPLCGHVCREGREWEYEEIEVQGRGIIRRRAE